MIEYQSRIFAVDVGSFNVLENHEHLVVRTRPDFAQVWSDEEVAWRWKCAWPAWDAGKWSCEPTDEAIEELLANTKKLHNARRNLASLSWFMARIKEPVARLANRETDKRGHFWEQRFGCRELCDDAAILACLIYVALNPGQGRSGRQFRPRTIRRFSTDMVFTGMRHFRH